MTAIIGYATDGKVTIGADGAQYNGWDRSTTGWPKVAQVADFLIGCAGTPRLLQLMQIAEWERPDPALIDPFMVLVGYVVPRLQEVVQAANFDWSDERYESTALLIGYRGGLYVIEHSWAVHHIEDGMYALGSGGDYALGALAVLHHHFAGTPYYHAETTVEEALTVAAQFSSACYGPFTVKTIG